jgi:hypothetical protein
MDMLRHLFLLFDGGIVMWFASFPSMFEKLAVCVYSEMTVRIGTPLKIIMFYFVGSKVRM